MIQIPEAETPDSEEKEVVSRTTTPLRSAPKTSWVEFKRCNKSTMQMSEIDHQLDAIWMQSFKDANYFAEHVSKSKATDRCYWKESHVTVRYLIICCNVIVIFFFVKVFRLFRELMRSDVRADLPKPQRCREI
jgi:hypothetical protein